MQEYVDLTSGHMEFLIEALDGDPGRLVSSGHDAAAGDCG